MMNDTVKRVISVVAGIEEAPNCAYNFRVNGKSIGRSNSLNVQIIPKEGGAGIDIRVRPGTKNETVYIPVVMDNVAMTDVVLNDFFIGEGCENVLIVAGCGIHNDHHTEARHDGIHTFHIGKNAHIIYRETHYGSGSASHGDRILNPVTNVILDAGSTFEMESFQLEGVDSTNRITSGILGDNSTLKITEKILTTGTQTARTEFNLQLNGENSGAQVTSRSVAKGSSYQEFISKIDGNNSCMGHSECDAIIMDKAVVKAVPEITAHHIDASLIHEAAIGKIAGEQIIKLMSLGLTGEEAEARIIDGFLKG